MIKDTDLKIICDVSRKYHAKRVFLFGSSTDTGSDARDIDIAVEGIRPEVFFDYYGDLILNLSKPVDVVDVSTTSKLNALILRDGVPIYG